MGSNRSAVIKFLVKTFLDHFESRGGIVSLPPDWREIMRQQDGRAFGQQQHAIAIRSPGAIQYSQLRVAANRPKKPKRKTPK